MPPQSALLFMGIGFFGSLAALIWPVIRGVPWSRVMRDIGWGSSINPVKEFACGLGAYVCMTPLILLSIIVVVILSAIVSPAGMVVGQLDGRNAPSHPIVFELAKSDPSVVITVLILACVAAPIVEEAMFRGVLYRHLRDSTVWMRHTVSVLSSAGVNSLIFAAIHPQGLIGIPVLATLAFGFSIVREWRDSLIAPMAMHAINNGMATALLLLILGGVH
jgi:membrane protease YdiL (CAAX protease family)